MPRLSPIPAFLAAMFVLGCRPDQSGRDQKAGGPTAQQRATADAIASNAAEDLRNALFAQRAQFVTVTREQLGDLNRRLDALHERIAKSSRPVQAEAGPRLAVLRERATQLKRRLGDATNATPSSWVLIKAECEKACGEISAGLAQSHEWFRGGAGP